MLATIMEQYTYMVLRMARVLLKIFVSFFLILLASRAYAANLGSVVKNDFAEMSGVESAKFTMLFWNIESESYTVKLSVKEAPKDWTIIMDPYEFSLNRETGEEYISLPYVDENVKAKVVNVFVKPSNSSKPNKYFVVIKAETIMHKNETNGISVIPERLFQFEINLNGFTTSNEENKIELSRKEFEINNDGLEMNSKKNENRADKEYFYLVAVTIVILFSIIIYKKINR